jgi:hypothetical protein
MMEERNYWTPERDPMLLWGAWVPLRGDAPAALVEWTKRIVVLAGELGIAEFRPDEDAEWWSREQVFAHIDRRLAEDGVVDAFEFAHAFKRTRSTLAYYDRAGIVERPVEDVGALLDRLRGPVSDWHRFAVDPAAPLAVSGHAIDYRPGATGMSAHELPTTSVEFKLHSDIWLPWVRGPLDPERDELYDNRELAARHSTRLNRFLDEVRRMTVDQGGTWHFFSFSQAPSLLAMAGPEGIRLLDTPVRRDR